MRLCTSRRKDYFIIVIILFTSHSSELFILLALANSLRANNNLFSLLQSLFPRCLASSASLKILIVPNKAVFWVCSNLTSILISSANFSRQVLYAPNIIASLVVTVIFFSAHIHAISFFNIFYFSVFSSSLSPTYTSPNMAVSFILVSFIILSTTPMFALQASIIESHWIVKFHKILQISFSMTLSGLCLYHFNVLSRTSSLLLLAKKTTLQAFLY